MRTLVLGGIRSGKSRWAETIIAESVPPGAPVRYLATGMPPDGADAAWQQRVAAHRARRPASWRTTESADVATQLRAETGAATLVDDIGGWLTAAMDRTSAWTGNAEQLDAAVDDLLAAVETFGSPLMLVSPEVGLAVLPATEAGRRFADAAGLLNQRLAAVCDRVVLVVAGLPIPVKPTVPIEPSVGKPT